MESDRSEDYAQPLAPATRLSRRNVLQRAALGGFALSGLPAFLAACDEGDGGSSASSDGSPASSGATGIQVDRYTHAIGSGLNSLDIGKEYSAGIYAHISNTYEAPMRITSEGELEAALAESWQETDARTIVLEIRQGVKFHDGTALTAEDVAFSLARNIDPKAPTGAGATYYGSVDSIKATSPTQVTIKLKRPDPVFLLVLGHASAYVHSKAYYQKAGKRFGTSEAPAMGTGPMKFTKFASATGYELARHEQYWDKPLGIKEFRCQFITDPQGLMLAMQSGEIDSCFDVPLDNIKPWEDVANVVVREDDIWYAFSFEMDAEPWNDIHIRRAVAHATDREALIKLGTSGKGRTAPSLMLPELLSDIASKREIDALYASLPRYEFDIDKAKAEMAQSSRPDGFKFKTVVPNTLGELNKMSQAAAQTLKEIGIELEIVEQPEEKVIVERWLGIPGEHKGNGMLTGMWTTAALPDPADLIKNHFAASAIAPGGFNYARWNNKRVEELIETQATTTDKKQRFAAISEIIRIAMEELPYVPIGWCGIPMATSRKYRFREGTANAWFLASRWMYNIVEA